ncbi:uncharacterized protein B0I36DRAFT_363126 [Microdochium trichocladiopsis]|uniref:Mpv17/PMP22 family protein n=1 Tax=Microdochium trichocladiopsis TaxID=1682393 RepID=A0A9P8Y6Y7_9PEZI|nr:uncharacterized protein B0I36DRAFT_363126 [Microdochium trichocladiopsis]KAH7031436.1 hypothetical protein B0I36DRAFT_363126 [Microdochium trichocladiopsis]
MIPSSPLHAVFRRHLNLLRQARLPKTPNAPKRPQSTNSQPPKHDTSSSSSPPPPPKAQDPIPVPNTVPPPPTFWQRLGPLTRAGQAYARTQRRHPYLTQTAATLVIYCAGDVAAQYIGRDDAPVATASSSSSSTTPSTTTTTTTKTATSIANEPLQPQPPSFSSQYDPIRTLRSMSIGGLAAIPGWHWFLFLSSNFNFPQSRFLSILTKVAINQALFTPLFNSYFFGAHSLLSGSTAEEALERIRRAVPVSMVNSLKLWPAVTAFSFAFIPIEFRSLFAGGIAIGWQAYLSFLNKEAAEAARRETAAAGAAAAVKACQTGEGGRAVEGSSGSSSRMAPAPAAC